MNEKQIKVYNENWDKAIKEMKEKNEEKKQLNELSDMFKEKETKNEIKKPVKKKKKVRYGII